MSRLFWDAAREEYETHFRRDDLANVIGGLKALCYNKSILVSTLRTTWKQGGIVSTLDDYKDTGQAPFEIEAEGAAAEASVGRAFAKLNVNPMSSTATVAFVSGVIQHSPRMPWRRYQLPV